MVDYNILTNENGKTIPVKLEGGVDKHAIRIKTKDGIVTIATTYDLSQYLYGDTLLMILANNELFPLERKKMVADFNLNPLLKGAVSREKANLEDQIGKITDVLGKFSDPATTKATLAPFLEEINDAKNEWVQKSVDAIPSLVAKKAARKGVRKIHVHLAAKYQKHVFFPISVWGKSGEKVKVDAAVDSGSEISIVSPHFAKQMNFELTGNELDISGVQDDDNLVTTCPEAIVHFEIAPNISETSVVAIMPQTVKKFAREFVIGLDIYNFAKEKGIPI